MKELRSSLLCILLCLLPIAGFGKGFPSFDSEIPGVSIWIVDNDAHYPYESFEDKSNEFIAYCDGKNTVYIHELEKRIPCKSIETYKNEIYRIDLIHTGRDLKGKITVSKNSLGKAAYTVTQPSIKNINSVAKTLASRKLALDSENKDYIHSNIHPGQREEAIIEYERQKILILENELFKEQIRKKFEINAKEKRFLIVPVGAELQGIGWNLRSAVFLNINGNPKYIGEINGCLDNILDITSDGIPEIGTFLCENDEGTYHAYSSIFPTIKEIVSRSH